LTGLEAEDGAALTSEVFPLTLRDAHDEWEIRDAWLENRLMRFGYLNSGGRRLKAATPVPDTNIA
jgi:hypothetical protein